MSLTACERLIEIDNEGSIALGLEDVCRLDIGGKRTVICVIDGSGKTVWRGSADTHPEMIDGALERFKGSLDKVGLESGPFTPHLFRSLQAIGYPMICMDARRAADAIKSRRIKSDKGDAWALAEMLGPAGFPRSTSSRSTRIG